MRLPVPLLLYTPATGTIVFYAQIADQFHYNGGTPPHDMSVDKDDPINNCVTISGEVYTNTSPLIHPMPTGTGVIAEDDSISKIAIVTDSIKKTVYKVVRPYQRTSRHDRLRAGQHSQPSLLEPPWSTAECAAWRPGYVSH